jgi:hypothetical protein
LGVFSSSYLTRRTYTGEINDKGFLSNSSREINDKGFLSNSSREINDKGFLSNSSREINDKGFHSNSSREINEKGFLSNNSREINDKGFHSNSSREINDKGFLSHSSRTITTLHVNNIIQRRTSGVHGRPINRFITLLITSLDGFPRNLIFDDLSKFCLENSSVIKI